MTTPTFPKLDPATPAFWDARFQADFTPWDRGGVPTDFARFVAAHAPMKTLIPGCGNAHEISLLLSQDWDVTAIDFSPEAVKRARDSLIKRNATVDAHKRIVEADFFAAAWQARQFECVYECAFLCALPHHLRQAWASQMAAIIPPGGLLAGYFFFDASEKGPPFGISEEALAQLLGEHFRVVENRAPLDSISVFVNRERWMVWQRLPT
jgi:trans-aconitate methyltransferase